MTPEEKIMQEMFEIWMERNHPNFYRRLGFTLIFLVILAIGGVITTIFNLILGIKILIIDMVCYFLLKKYTTYKIRQWEDEFNS